MQTPRELVRSALLFETPQRVPRDLWVLPWAENRFGAQLQAIRQRFPNDIVRPPQVYQPSPRVQGDPFVVGQFTDDWGCCFENLQAGVIGEVKEPLITDITDLSALQPPYETLPADPSQARDTVNKFCAETDCFVIAGCCPRPWERMQFLRGTVNAMMDIVAEPEHAHVLLERIHEFHMKELEFWATTDVDAMMFMDDWGSQNNLLIPPTAWQEFFQPLYRDYCAIARAHDKFTFMHSDGCITEIYPHLVEVGVNAVNSQLFCMDMDELAAQVKGKITFWGEIDRQHILPSDDIADVTRGVQTVVDKLYDPAGGVIAQLEFGPAAKPENVEAAFAAWERV